ncbi:D123-domain-containing protein [Aaosphaeria arxii CBS 175.79]|uniref:D123-domain-containing protein n=1 Tax=Aaosphaeria arxii CBS 175.79 TaxID=1450172 RepID=A0A6A5XST6_9PLEO|nr:D123-domain-containing protein [Aaosphaeria arxii CBS 175.79]KAF2016368.1 D123-domain-containing protein [Aaosphaeria arxii CBS 175.79]
MDAGGLTDKAKQNRLPFPPVTKRHIMNCSYHSWHPKYRTITPKARLIPLPGAFLEYLRADGIVLPPEEADNPEWSDGDSGIFSGADNEAGDDGDDDENFDPSTQWRNTHEEVARIIEELGGKVAPKLNWSAPKDATWINATNSMQCSTPNDIYLMLKSSDFITHDLQQVFDDTEPDDPTDTNSDPVASGISSIPYHLILRKWITLNPSVEFRVFVRNRKIIAICQRDLNHFDFLFSMQDRLRQEIQDFFSIRIKDTFPDDNFTFDVYIPPPHNRVWLIDVNPWAPRTDPLLFAWLELLEMPEPADPVSYSTDESEEDEVIEPLFVPEFRLVRKDDPEAYGFVTPQFSAHKMPKDVVDASQGGEGVLREFANNWKEAQRLAEEQRREDSEDD